MPDPAQVQRLHLHMSEDKHASLCPFMAIMCTCIVCTRSVWYYKFLVHMQIASVWMSKFCILYWCVIRCMHLYFHMKKICTYTQDAPNSKNFMIGAITQSSRAHYCLMLSLPRATDNIRPVVIWLLDMPHAMRCLNANVSSCSFAMWLSTLPNNSIKSACAQ